MLQKIIEFFRSLFGGSRSQTRPTPPTPPPSTSPSRTSAQAVEIDPEEPQDGSEIQPDTVVVIHDEPAVLDLPASSSSAPLPSESLPDTPTTETEPTPEGGNTPTENEPVAASHQARFMWCLDNGHGSQTAGKRSPKMADGSQFFEYEFNRDIVKRIMAALDERGVRYFNVVPEVDTDNFLEGRVKRANDKSSDLPKLFVSIHANAAPARSGKWASANIKGIETWFFHNSRSGRKLAAVFQKHLIAETGWNNRKIKSQATRQFYVLRNTKMTAILTENGFYNNKAECAELMKDAVRQKIADAHVAAIMEVEEKGIV
ncbi:MAG: N-acetylmuramoyl-L-alanine amidase [Bacteroidota bacterium]